MSTFYSTLQIFSTLDNPITQNTFKFVVEIAQKCERGIETSLVAFL